VCGVYVSGVCVCDVWLTGVWVCMECVVYVSVCMAVSGVYVWSEVYESGGGVCEWCPQSNFRVSCEDHKTSQHVSLKNKKILLPNHNIIVT